MQNDSKKQGTADGFAQGWSDGLNNYPAIPHPAIVLGLFDPGYLLGFKQAYADGHATAKRERGRQAELLEAKANHLLQQRERDDI